MVVFVVSGLNWMKMLNYFILGDFMTCDDWKFVVLLLKVYVHERFL